MTRFSNRSLFLVLAVFLAVSICRARSAAASPAPAGRFPIGAESQPIAVVAAENEYGSMVGAIGGNRVRVTSLLNNPNTDPHEFEASASTARIVSSAAFVIENGLGYDTWLDKLLSASPRPNRRVLTVGTLLGFHTGDNPHAWYDPNGWRTEADAIATDITALDPSHRAYFQARERAWLTSLSPIYREIARVRRLIHGKPVIATEPVFGYMLRALGAPSLDPAFGEAVMNGVDPSPRSVAQFESDLKSHAVRMLFFNSQVIDPTTAAMRDLARKSGVPVVGVTETQPPNATFVSWQLDQLRNIARSWK